MSCTLKKSLALVLAIVLVVGVCAFQVAAFTDDEAISHDEAVAVLTGIGVIKGRDTGAFDPAATLTRAEAATIITRLKGQEDLQAKSNFDDMKGHWAESYVAYCAAEGIVNGVGDNKFDPDAKLTGNQWGKMLLVAMGYDPAETGLDKGDTWEVAVAKLVKAKNLKSGVEALDMNAPISREDTCVLAFNGLGQSVSGNKSYVTADGVAFDNALDAVIYAQISGTMPITISTPTDSLQANFPTLSEDASYVDEFGRPGRQWNYGDPAEAIYTETEAANYSYTAKADETISMANINKALGLKTAKTMLTAAAGIEVFYNGEAATLNTDSYVAGDLVEVYTEKLEAKTIVITHYELATVTAVTELKASEIVEDDPSTVKIDLELTGGAKLTGIRDANFPGFEYGKGDYILIAKDSTDAILASDLAELIGGKIDGMKSGTWRIAGAFYAVAPSVIATGWVAPAIGQEATWALDPAGKLGAVVVVEEETTASTDYAMIYNVVATTSGGTGLNEDGQPDASTTDYTVYAVRPDGTKLSAPAWTDKDGKVQTAISGFTAPIVVAYELKDGALKIVTGAYNIVAKSGVTLNKSATVDTDAFANSSTKYVTGAWDGSSYKVNVVTGYKNAVLTAADITYVVNSKTKTVLYVFAASGIAAVDDSEPVPAVAVLADANPMITKDEDDNDVYTYSVIIDGAEAELASATPISVAEGDIFEYETVNDMLDPASVVVHDASEKVTVEYVSGNQVNAGGKEYSQAGAKVYAFDEDGAVIAGELEIGQTVLLIANSKNVISYAFIDYAP